MDGKVDGEVIEVGSNVSVKINPQSDSCEDAMQAFEVEEFIRQAFREGKVTVRVHRKGEREDGETEEKS